MSIGVALIGGGIWAREEHLPAVQASKDLVLKAVFSRTLKSAESISAQSPGIEIYSDESGRGYDELLKQSDVSAVIISLPIKNQKTYIEAALKAGKHVLSEKPVGENVQDAADLIKWYRSSIKGGATWCVAENYRFLQSFEIARAEIQKLGKVIGFQVRTYANIEQGWKFYETEWRKNPTHQGGFLLDGGVHYTAGLRKLLSSCHIARLSAYSNLLKPYLPPVDTLNAVMKTNTGVSGAFQQSVGTTLRGTEYTVACEKGVVSTGSGINLEGNRDSVKVVVDGKEEVMEVENERTGVPPLVRAWGEALAAGKIPEALEPEAALADLELMELMLRSGEKEGVPMDCVHQDV